MSLHDDEVTECTECGALNDRFVNPVNCRECGADLGIHRFRGP